MSVLQRGLTLFWPSADELLRRPSMSDLPDIRRFGYRNPRYPFPKVVNLEIPQEVSFQVAAARGVDISVDGIAVAADTSFDLNKPIVLVIPLPDGTSIRVPGRVLCQSERHC